MKVEKEKIKVEWIKKAQIIVLTLLVVYVAIVISKLVVLRSIAHKQTELAKSMNNWHRETVRISTEGISKLDIYCKDSKIIMKTDNSGVKNAMVANTVIYQSEEETIHISDFQEEKTVQTEDRKEGDYIIVESKKRTFLEDLKYAMFRNIQREKINGIDVYILNENGTQNVINRKTGEIIKGISNNYEEISTIEYNTVTDEDVKRPDLT